MNIFILGGTGFLGYHAALELLKRGHSVSTLSLPPLPAEGIFPPEFSIKLGNVNALSDDEIRDLMVGMDGVIFAAGADDRIIPKAPAYPYFYDANVKAAQRFFGLARTAGVKRGVLLGSYFAYFNRIWPELALAKKHPYIRSRKEQEEAVLETAGTAMQIVVLELPYIFGAMPGRIPLWKPLVNYAASSLPFILYPRGGTAMVSVRSVACAMVGALENKTSKSIYQIGDENLTWVEFFERLMPLLGVKKKVITLADGILNVGLHILKFVHWLEGKQSGLDPAHLIELQARNTFFDPFIAQKELGFKGGDFDQALFDTIQAVCKAS